MIIGCSGLAGSGKDTVADYIVDNYKGFIKISFADKIKRICKDLYDFSDGQLWGPSEERNKPDIRYPRDHGPWKDNECMCCGTKEENAPNVQCHLCPRLPLLLMGTECGRTCYLDTWVDCAFNLASSLKEGGWHYTPQKGLIEDIHPLAYGKYNVVINDVRFMNEINFFHNKEEILIRIKRPGAGLKTSAGLHPSELEQLSIPDSAFDYIINNDSTPEHLYSEVDKIMNDLI